MDELPETLDETYARTLKEIDKKNWEYAHRLFHCVAAASRPLFVDELAEFLAFDFEAGVAGSTPTLLAEWRPEDSTHAVLSICSSLLAVVKLDDNSSVVQFAHFSVKEYLTSARLAGAMDTISRFHVSMTTAHTIIAQACLGVLLHFDEDVTKDSLEEFPLTDYAAEHWVGHARFENVSSRVQDGMERLFDPSKSHLSVWTWIYDPNDFGRRYGSSKIPRATPLHYAACCGMHDAVKFLIVKHSQDINARGFSRKETPLHVASRNGLADIAQLLLEHGADANAQDDFECTPLYLASRNGFVEVARVLLEHDADTEARGFGNWSPLIQASAKGHVEVVRVLLEHGADANAPGYDVPTPLHFASNNGDVGVARVLLEHGADANARDDGNATPLHLACHWSELPDIVRLLLHHGADIHARDDEGQTPFMRVAEQGESMMQLLLEHGAEDHRMAITTDADSRT